MMLIQLQHENLETGEREFIAQTDMGDDFAGRYYMWLQDVSKRHPLPPNHRWRVCTDEESAFFWQVSEV